MNLVVDACVVVKWFAQEIFSDEAALLTDENKFELHAPELILPEFGNIIWKKFRQGEITEHMLYRIAQTGFDRQIVFHSHEPLFELALVRASETGQTVYDWTYLSLAQSLFMPFVTADERFYNAVKTTRFKDDLLWIGDITKFI